MGNPEASNPDTTMSEQSAPDKNNALELIDNDISIWRSLAQNLRDLFAKDTRPPLVLTARPAQVDALLHDEPLWKSLRSNLKETFFPAKLPPLELTAQPVPVPDLLAVPRDTKSSVASFLIHAAILGIILLLAYLAGRGVKVKPEPMQAEVIKPFMPITAPMAKAMGGGGGGGSHDVVEASKGHLPKIDKLQITPPTVIHVDHPKIPVPPTVIMQPIKVPDNNLPNLGVQNSPQVKLASNGTGGGAGIGSGTGTGVGVGSGAGVGPGSGANYGGGVYQIGGAVAPPQLVYSVEPEFSDEARRAKYQGVVALSVVINTQGRAVDITVVRHLGMGLDQKAIDAVRQYRFRPAMMHGKAVPVYMTIEVDFHLF